MRCLVDVGSFWEPLGALWPPFSDAFWDLFSTFALRPPLRSILERFGCDLGSILDRFGGLWGAFWESVGVSWASLGCFSDLASDLKSCTGVMLTFCARRLRERF